MIKRLILLFSILFFITYLHTSISCAETPNNTTKDKTVEIAKPEPVKTPDTTVKTTKDKVVEIEKPEINKKPDTTAKTAKDKTVEIEKPEINKKPDTTAKTAKDKVVEIEKPEPVKKPDTTVKTTKDKAVEIEKPELVKTPVPITNTANNDVKPVAFDKDAEINRLKLGLKSDKVFERWKSAYESGRNADPIMVDGLIGALHDLDLKVRIEAIQALGKIGSDKAVDHLIPLLKDSKSGIRMEALKSLIMIGTPSVKPLIIELETMRYNDKKVIVTALKTITGKNYNSYVQWIQWSNSQPSEVTEKSAEKLTKKSTIQKPLENEIVTEDISDNLTIEERAKAENVDNKNKLKSKGKYSRTPVKPVQLKSEADKTVLVKSIPPPPKSADNISNKPVTEKTIPEKTEPAKPVPAKSETAKPEPAKSETEKSVPIKTVPEKSNSKKSPTNKSNVDKSFEELEEESNRM